jgi:hypothetical protein
MDVSAAGASSSGSKQTISTVAGKYYEISYSSSSTSGLIRRLIVNSPTAVLDVNTTAPYVKYIFLAGGTSTTIIFASATNSAGSRLYDNISVKELAGNHATQATTASRPTYGIVPLGGRRNLLLATDTKATQSLTVAAVAHTLAFTGTGTVTLTGASVAGPLVGTGASNRVSLTFTPTAASLTLTVVGSVTLAQLELGSTATAYQRVTTQYDVTEAGVQSLSYLAFDGVDDFLVTPTITPGIDKVQVFAGVRKLSDAAAGVIAELSISINVSAGSFYLLGPRSASTTYDFTSRGSVLPTGAAFISGYAAPITNILTGLGDISGDRQTLRVNGMQVAQDTSDQGTGNYLAYPIYIGRRAGTSLPFNGQIYGVIVRFGANLDAGTITSTENWINGKTGAY